MYGRACTVTLKKGDSEVITINSKDNDWLNVKFKMDYNLNDNFAKASVGICGLSQETAKKLLEHFAQGVAMRDLKNTTTVELKAGYIGGGKEIAHLFTGTAWDARLSGTPDVWLTMNCSTSDAQANMASVVVINEGMKFEDACKKICKTLTNVEPLWAVTSKEAKEMKVPHWTSGSIGGVMSSAKVAEVIEDLGKGLVMARVRNDLNLSPILIMDKKSSEAAWNSVMGECKTKAKKYSCTGNSSTDGLVIGIPQPTVNGIELDVQLDSEIKIGTIFEVESNMMSMINKKKFAVLTYSHSGELRGNEWTTHISAIGFEQELWLQE